MTVVIVLIIVAILLTNILIWGTYSRLFEIRQMLINYGFETTVDKLEKEGLFAEFLGEPEK